MASQPKRGAFEQPATQRWDTSQGKPQERRVLQRPDVGERLLNACEMTQKGVRTPKPSNPQRPIKSRQPVGWGDDGQARTCQGGEENAKVEWEGAPAEKGKGLAPHLGGTPAALAKLRDKPGGRQSGQRGRALGRWGRPGGRSRHRGHPALGKKLKLDGLTMEPGCPPAGSRPRNSHRDVAARREGQN